MREHRHKRIYVAIAEVFFCGSVHAASASRTSKSQPTASSRSLPLSIHAFPESRLGAAEVAKAFGSPPCRGSGSRWEGLERVAPRRRDHYFHLHASTDTIFRVLGSVMRG